MGLILWAVLIAAFITLNVLPDLRGDGTYYTASRLLLRGEAGPRLYDDEWMRGQILSATQGRVSDIFTPNPPTATLLAFPVAFFPPDVARRVWAVVNAVVLVGTVGILLHERGARSSRSEMSRRQGAPTDLPAGYVAHHPESRLQPEANLILAFALFAAPIVDGFRLGQAYIILLGLYALAWLGVRRGWSWLTGLSLALALCLKASGAPLWLLLAARRQWRALGWGAFAAMAIIAVTLRPIGLETWRVYATGVLPRALASPTLSVTAYQSLAGFWAHLFRYDALWNPSPLADWPAVAAACAVISGAIVLGLTLFVTRRARLEIAFGAIAMASVFLVPFAEQYHYTLAVLPVWVAMGEWNARGKVAPARRSYVMVGVFLVLALLLIALPLPFRSSVLTQGGWALLAYPRLYGGLLLWVALLYCAGSFKRHRSPALAARSSATEEEGGG